MPLCGKPSSTPIPCYGPSHLRPNPCTHPLNREFVLRTFSPAKYFRELEWWQPPIGTWELVRAGLRTLGVC